MPHAQSDDFEHSCDFERPLSARGQQDAAHMRHWFHAQGYHPQNALVSAAKRTAETYDLLQVENCHAFLSKALYLAPATTLLTALKKTTGSPVLMIGNNFWDLRSGQPFAQKQVGKPRIQNLSARRDLSS